MNLLSWTEMSSTPMSPFSYITGSHIMYCSLWYWCLVHTGVWRLFKAIWNFCICLWIIAQKKFLSYIHAGVGTTDSALDEDGVLEIDTNVSLETTWHAMEDLVSMGLVRSIGIRCTDILKILSTFQWIGNICCWMRLFFTFHKTISLLIMSFIIWSSIPPSF